MWLEEDSYGLIEYNMAHVDHRVDSTLQTINSTDSYLRKLPIPRTTPAILDSSLARQMDELDKDYDPVDAFFFTVQSAVPVADTLRGYYQALDVPAPPLEPVYANSRDGILHFNDNSYCNESEEARLRKVVNGANHVAVVDQYVSSGCTLLYAAQLLLKAGAKRVTAIAGDWYDETMRGDVDVASMTSYHSDFMRQVGRNCIESPQRLDYLRIS